MYLAFLPSLVHICTHSSVIKAEQQRATANERHHRVQFLKQPGWISDPALYIPFKSISLISFLRTRSISFQAHDVLKGEGDI